MLVFPKLPATATTTGSTRLMARTRAQDSDAVSATSAGLVTTLAATSRISLRPVTRPAAISTRITETIGWRATMPSASPAASTTARNPPAMRRRRIRAVITSGRFGDVHRHVN